MSLDPEAKDPSIDAEEEAKIAAYRGRRGGGYVVEHLLLSVHVCLAVVAAAYDLPRSSLL